MAADKASLASSATARYRPKDHLLLASLSSIATFASEGSSKENFADFHVDLWVWGAFLAVVVVLLVADLLLVHKTAHVISTKEAAIESAIWISIGLAFTRSEEHTSELQSLMRHSSAVFCVTQK